jgi:hypothetical protein
MSGLNVKRLLSVGLALLLAACSAPALDPTATSPASATPVGIATSAPEATVGPPALPTPDATTGVVTGRIINQRNSQPVVSAALYLGNLVPLEPGPEYLITLDQKASPHVTLDAGGYFLLPSVPPGTYGLIVWTPVVSRVAFDLEQPDKEKQVTVEAGKMVDVGEVLVDWP